MHPNIRFERYLVPEAGTPPSSIANYHPPGQIELPTYLPRRDTPQERGLHDSQENDTSIPRAIFTIVQIYLLNARLLLIKKN
mmetsp:Transcript_39530/g.64706  ORF Transcript_39530/g.64706 Transcript_39530/m.64706 type:complete len:82 (-) Transcript_39530:310-555(-)